MARRLTPRQAWTARAVTLAVVIVTRGRIEEPPDVIAPPPGQAPRDESGS